MAIMMNDQQERITLIDSLRGYALMGLFIVHMAEYYELFWYAPKQDAIVTWVFRIFGGKAYAMFAMLFGVSFYIILKRNAERGIDFRGRFIWRVLLLLGIGYLHGLIYSGDVLQVLAVAGLLLVPLWSVPRWMVVTISMLLLSQSTTYAFVAWMGSSDVPYLQPFFMDIQKWVYEFYAHGTFGQVVAANATGGTLGKWSYMLESGRFANVVGLALLGFWLSARNFFTDVERYGRTYLPLLCVTTLAATGCYFATHVFMLIPHPEKMDDAWMGIMDTYFNTLVMFVTVLILLLLYRHRAIQKILSLLAAPGRMTLTLYVGQSLLMVPFFYHFGGDAYRWIGQPASLLLGIALWIIQVIAAQWWMRNFNYGPLEWCWRAATYATTRIAFRRSHN